MSINFAESRTKDNLMRAFAGESQARNRYTFAAGQAKKEGLNAIADIFLYTAGQEKEHAEIFYNYLCEFSGENIEIDGTYPVDIYDNTVKLLRAGEHNEYEEYNDVYQSFGDIAKEEGFINIAESFYKIAQIEKSHGDRFGMIAELLESNRLYSDENKGKWICLNCGHIHEGNQVPPKCPVCSHDKGYFLPADLAPYYK